jgi:hypothetical protein
MPSCESMWDLVQSEGFASFPLRTLITLRLFCQLSHPIRPRPTPVLETVRTRRCVKMMIATRSAEAMWANTWLARLSCPRGEKSHPIRRKQGQVSRELDAVVMYSLRDGYWETKGLHVSETLVLLSTWLPKNASYGNSHKSTTHSHVHRAGAS